MHLPRPLTGLCNEDVAGEADRVAGVVVVIVDVGQVEVECANGLYSHRTCDLNIRNGSFKSRGLTKYTSIKTHALSLKGLLLNPRKSINLSYF